MRIILPHRFQSRPYQQEVFNKFFLEGYRYIILIWPRRHGKDRTAFNILIGEALRRVGLYYYAYPNRVQAKTAIWEGVMADGTSFYDHIPKSLIKSQNKSELKTTLINNSVIMLVGMDYYNNFVGTNAFGICFSEFAVGTPLAFKYMRPMLRENNGFAIFPYTPRGHNHGYDLYQTNKNNKDWFCSFKTVEDCVDEFGVRYMSEEQVEAERRSGMSENLIRQEYYCDFESTLEGAIFDRQISKAYKENRICDFQIDSNLLVYTFWDLGWNDYTAIWFMQYDPKTEFWKAIYYYQDNFQKMAFYIKKVLEIQNKLGLCFGGHFPPHDISVTDWKDGVARLEYARQLGFKFNHPVKRLVNVENGIERARFIFDKVKFHKTNCEDGINALKSFVRVQNQTSMEYGKYKHDWASHGSMAFVYFACAEPGLISDKSFYTVNTVDNSW